MKALSEKSTKIMAHIIGMMNGGQHIKIDNTNGSFMPVVCERTIEDIKIGMLDADIYSLAHYYEQNGDLVPDPDVEFAVSKDLKTIIPLAISNMMGYAQYVILNDDGSGKIDRENQDDLNKFCSNIWLENINQQQNLNVN
jgi:hypothetical protein